MTYGSRQHRQLLHETIRILTVWTLNSSSTSCNMRSPRTPQSRLCVHINTRKAENHFIFLLARLKQQQMHLIKIGARKAEQINFSIHQHRVIVFCETHSRNTRARRWVLSSNKIKIASFLPHRAVVAASHVALNTSRIQRVKCDLAKIIINWRVYSGFDWRITHGFNQSTCSTFMFGILVHHFESGVIVCVRASCQFNSFTSVWCRLCRWCVSDWDLVLVFCWL